MQYVYTKTSQNEKHAARHQIHAVKKNHAKHIRYLDKTSKIHAEEVIHAGKLKIHAGKHQIHAERMIIHAVKFKSHAVHNYSYRIVIILKFSDKIDKKVPKTIDIFLNIKSKSASDCRILKLSHIFSLLLVIVEYKFAVIISCEIVPSLIVHRYYMSISEMQLGCKTLVDRCTGIGCGTSGSWGCGVGWSIGGRFLFFLFMVITLACFDFARCNFSTLMYISDAIMNMKPDEMLTDSNRSLMVMFVSLSFRCTRQYTSMLIAIALSNMLITMLYMNISCAFIMMNTSLVMVNYWLPTVCCLLLVYAGLQLVYPGRLHCLPQDHTVRAEPKTCHIVID